MRSEEQGKKVASAFGKKYGKRSFCQTKIHLKKQKRQHSRWVLPSLILFLSLTIVEHDEGCPIVGFLISHVAQMLLGADKSLTLAHTLR